MLMRRPTTLLLAATAGIAAGLPAGLSLSQDELPVSAVTLYRSGVGSFERAGTVAGDATVTLSATADQINDLLKSLVVMDLDGGRVGAVTYTADEPVKRLVEALGISDPSQITLTKLLASFRGATVTIETTDSTINGRILGTDTVSRPVPGQDSVVQTQRVSVLTAAGIRTVSEHDIRSLTLDDPQLRADMDALLEALATQRTERSRSLEIELRGNGDRRVRAAYVQEAPIWKTSYRIILPEKGGDPVGLQGWAIVENTTDSDWDGITLSLVAGRPVGFEMDLSQPLFVPRPTLPVPIEMAAASKAFAGGQSFFDGDERGRDRAGRASSDQMAPIGRGQNSLGLTSSAAVGEFAESVLADAEVMRQSMASAAAAGQSGEVFFYRLSDPVTIGRQQSAMLPITAADIQGRRVSVSSPADAGHPMLGAEITNTSGLKLMPGPISVYDGTAFAGDAQIGYVGAGDERLLAFGVDLDVQTERSSDQRSVLTKLVIRDGVYVRTSAEESVQTVELTSNDEDRGRTMIVEVPRLSGWELDAGGPDPYEVTESLYRFEVDLKPSGAETLAVTQRRTIDSTVGLTRGDLSWVLRHHQSGAASEAVLAAAREFARRNAEVNRLQAAVSNLDNDITTITQDQNRIRGLLGPLSRQDQLYSRYLRQLEVSEDRLETLRTQRAEAESERRTKRSALDEWMRGLTIE
ncbi:MAG: hypothetical protein AAGF47_00355 [Planctomycetota bacterium]